jgi:peroxiredoxin
MTKPRSAATDPTLRQNEGDMAKELAEGDSAPDFELKTDGGGRARLKDLKGKLAVIYFYPKDDTSGQIRRRRNRGRRRLAGQRCEPRQVQA